MRTGNGRHRRPRQAPALFVTAGVTGAGIALPLLGASGAHAADASTWDRVAQCESGGTWSADQGGVYGGLALTETQWRHYGGLAYASRPDMASRAEQITVAEELLSDQGPGAWTTCARDSDLEQGGRPADVDPGATSSTPAASPSGETGGATPGTAGTSGSSGESRGSAAGTSAGGGTDENGSPSAAVSPVAPSGTAGGEGSPGSAGRGTSSDSDSIDPSATPTDGTGGAGHAGTSAAGSEASGSGSAAAGRHRGQPDPSEDNGKVTGAQRGGGGDAASRATGGTGRAGLGGAGDADGVARAGRYTVRPGDNLSVIAERHDVDGGWPALYASNKGVVGADPDLIHPGQLLSLHP